METQPENHNDKRKVSSEEILEFLLEVKALAEQEKKAKENKATALKLEDQQDTKKGWYQATSSFTTS